MKKINYKLSIFLFVGMLFVIYSCSKSFLEKRPIGPTDQTTLANKDGVAGLLIGAYSLLDGIGGASGGWGSAASNWVYGGVQSDDAYKGSESGDQPDINPIETYSVTASNGYPIQKWNLCYDGIQRANDVLRVMALAEDMTEQEKKLVEAEVKFLRGHYHFELKRVFNYVPFIDETISYSAGNYKVSNKNGADFVNIWPNIEADFQFAAENLPATQPQVGRANSWAAKAYLGKVYLYQQKWAQAKEQFDAVIQNGTTSNGLKYELTPIFADNFNPAKKNNSESVFAAQMSVQDGAGGFNGNYGDALNFPSGGPANCCGFYQPSQSLVNSYKVNAAGLPLLDTYNQDDVKNDLGVPATSPFTPDTRALDPRLDWTVGRRGIPYLDYGVHPGAAWIRLQSYGGPYSPIKNVYYKSQTGQLSDTYDGWATNQVTANNVTIIRFADVLLMAAEAEVELGNLEAARALVNRVRRRAANPAGFVKNGGADAANYEIGEYTAAWTDKATAQKAVRFERKLELAMEGVRFFDLVRWGIADVELNAYLNKEKATKSYLANAQFVKGKNEYMPIPQEAIDRSAVDGVPTIEQNPAYK